MSGKITGRYFAAGVNASVAATLKLNGSLVAVQLADGENLPAQDLIEISHRLARVPRKITLADGSTFETDDNDGVDALFDIGEGFVARLTRVEGSLKLVLVLVACTVVLLAGLYRYGLPALATGAARITPSSVLTLMDKGTLVSIDKLLFDASTLSASRRDDISTLFDELAKQSGQTNPPLHLLFRNSELLGPNAIALPGGTIIITDQLIKLARSDDEIAGVLAHEIGHVEYRHSARQIYRVLGLGFMLSVIGGDSGQLVEDVIAQAAALDSLSYSRKFETEADFRSAELMVALNRDPYAFIELLKRLTDDDGSEDDTGWLSTHPGTLDRRQTVEKYVTGLRTTR